MEAPISDNDDELMEVVLAAHPQGAHPRLLQHVLHGCQQLQHRAVSYCVVLHSWQHVSWGIDSVFLVGYWQKDVMVGLGTMFGALHAHAAMIWKEADTALEFGKRLIQLWKHLTCGVTNTYTCANPYQHYIVSMAQVELHPDVSPYSSARKGLCTYLVIDVYLAVYTTHDPYNRV